MTKHQAKATLEEGIYFASQLMVPVTMLGKAWQLELEAIGPAASTVRQNGEVNADAQLISIFLSSLGSQPQKPR